MPCPFSLPTPMPPEAARTWQAAWACGKKQPRNNHAAWFANDRGRKRRSHPRPVASYGARNRTRLRKCVFSPPDSSGRPDTGSRCTRSPQPDKVSSLHRMTRTDRPLPSGRSRDSRLDGNPIERPSPPALLGHSKPSFAQILLRTRWRRRRRLNQTRHQPSRMFGIALAYCQTFGMQSSDIPAHNRVAPPPEPPKAGAPSGTSAKPR